MPLTRGKAEQRSGLQRYIVKCVLISTSSRQRGAISGSPLREQRTFDLAVAAGLFIIFLSTGLIRFWLTNQRHPLYPGYIYIPVALQYNYLCIDIL